MSHSLVSVENEETAMWEGFAEFVATTVFFEPEATAPVYRRQSLSLIADYWRVGGDLEASYSVPVGDAVRGCMGPAIGAVPYSFRIHGTPRSRVTFRS